MKLTLRGESIDIKLGQEVTFYKYILNSDKVEFKEDKVVVESIENQFGDENVVNAAFRNDFHGATFLHYEMGDFYLSISDKNVLDFLTKKYKHYQKREKHLKYDMDILVKQVEGLSDNKAKLIKLIQHLCFKLGEDLNIEEESNLDINKSLYNIENRKEYEYDDDIATLFYKGYKVAKGTTETFRCNWCEEVSYCKDMNDFLDDIGIELAIELDDEDVKDNWEHIWDKLDWNEESKSYKYKNWEWVVLDL